MKTNRRKFMGLLGLGAASGPLAAKAAVDAEIAGLTKIGSNALCGGGNYIAGAASMPTTMDGGSNYTRASNYVRAFGIPTFFDRQARESAKYVHSLDPDIACKRSWSMSVKIQEQRQRNYERQIESLHYTSWMQEKRELLFKLTGFHWPW